MYQGIQKLSLVFISILIFLGGFFVFQPKMALAAAGINKQVNFQGKVVNADGTNVTNGSYNFLFCIYTTGSPATACTAGALGSALWKESKSITVTDGIFQTNLGDTDTTLGSVVDFNTDNIYLGMNFNSNGQMTPLVQFTASPYAFNSDNLDGKDWTNPGTIGTSATTLALASGGTSTWTNTSGGLTISTATSGTLALTSAGALNFSGAGASYFNTSAGNISFQVAGTGTSGTLQVGGGGAGSVTPDFFGLDVKSSTGDPTGGFEGAMYYNTYDNKFRCYQGSAWADCGMSIGGAITTATAGSILYAGASGNLAQDNSNFYYDYTNHYLGLGTTTPAGIFDVRGGTATSGNGTSINVYAQNGFGTGNTNGGNIILMPGTANGSGTAGGVGIGSTPGTNRLLVYGNVASGGTIPTALASFISQTATYGSTNESNAVIQIQGRNGSNDRTVSLGIGVPSVYGGHDSGFLNFGSGGIWAADSGTLKFSTTPGTSYQGNTYKGFEFYNGASDNQDAYTFYSSVPTFNGTAMRVVVAATGGSGNLMSLESAQGGRFIVKNSGNVGIGTASPIANFQVAQPTTGPGTVSVSGTAVTGVGTQFTNTFKVGDNITVTTTSGSETKAITTVTSDTALVTAAFTGTASAGTAYTLVGGSRFSVLGNGNVGIGTTAPSTRLDIRDSYSWSTAIQDVLKFTPNISGGTNTQPTSYGAINFNDRARINAVNPNASAWNNTSLTFSTYAHSAPSDGLQERMVITSNGNVGIGDIATSYPSYILSLGGSAARTFGMNRNPTAATAGQGFIITAGGAIAGTADLAGGDLSIKSGISTGLGSSALHFYTATAASSTGSADNNPSEKMTILGNGNVGIGTTSITARLHSYVSNAAVTTTSYDGFFQNLATNTTTDAIDKYGMYITSTGAFTGSSGTATNNYGLYVATPTGGDNNYAAIFAGGNVGIGITSPGQKLTVDGTFGILEGGATPTYHTIFQGGDQAADITYTLPIAQAGGSGYVLSNTSGTLSWTAPGAASISMGSAITSATAGSILYAGAAGVLAQDNANFYYDYTNHRLGLGTTAPAANFQVFQPTTSSGTVSVSGTAVTGVGTQFTNTFKVGDNITVTTTSGSETKAITTVTSDTALVTAAFTGTASAGTAYTLVGGSRFSVLGNGNVGIGTTTPAGILDVRGGTAASGNGTSINMYAQNGFGTGNTNGGNIILMPGTANGSGIAGNVGIGTTAPGYKLDVNGSARLNNIMVETNSPYITGQNVWSTSHLALGSSGDLKLLTGNANPIYFLTNSQERMRIDSNGNVGIGTTTFDVTNPEKLLVNAGTTTSSSVIYGKGSIDNYLQLNIQNQSTGTSASSDVVATADNGSETTNFINMGINGSGYTAGIFGAADEGYLYNLGQNLNIGTGTAAKSLNFLTGGTTATVAGNIRMIIDGTGNVSIGTTSTAGKLSVENTNTSGTAGEYINNSIATGTLTDGLKIEQTGAGTMTNAIEILKTAGTIGTGLNIGNGVTTGISIGTGATTGISIASGGITISGGALAINNATGITSNQSTMIINASGTVDVQDILNADSVTSDAGVSIANNQTYTGAGIVNISSAAGSALNIDSGTVGGLNIGTDSSAETISIATGAAAKALTIGSTNTTSSTIIQSGTGSIKLQGTGGTISAPNVIQIGAGGAGSTNPDVFSLDTKTLTGDPTAAGTPNGSMYYNVGDGKFRCLENGVWVNCITASTATNPGGATTQIQFNDGGSFGGDADFAWDKTGNALSLGGVDTGIILNGITNEPATPATGNLRVYSKSIAGRMLPKWLAPSGVDTSFQSSLGFNRIATVTPAGGTTLATAVAGYATAFTNVGTVANPSPAGTNALTSTRRVTFSTGASAGALASHRQATTMVWRGNSVAYAPGGFFFTMRFGTSTLASGNRAFVGLSDTITAPTNVDPTTSTAGGKVGLAINASTGNWNFIQNVAGSAPVVTGLGTSFPVNNTALYELVLYSKPNDTVINYRVTNLSTGAQVTGNTGASNIPTATTFLAPLFWITNNLTASAAIIDFGGWYLESDQ